jgi:diguanylate cyclase
VYNNFAAFILSFIMERHVNNIQDQLFMMKKLSEISENFLQYDGSSPIDYQKITDDLVELSKAKYAAFNLYDLAQPYFHTVALSGEVNVINKANAFLGFDISEKKWPFNEATMNKLRQKTTNRYSDLIDFAGDVLPLFVSKGLQSLFHISEIILVKIVVNQEMIGDFILLMEKGTEYSAESIIEIYSRQVGMLVIRKRTHDALVDSEEKYRLITDRVSDVIAVINLSLNKTTYVSPSIFQQRGYTVEEAMNQTIESSLTPESWAQTKQLIESEVAQFIANPSINTFFVSEVQQVHKDGHLLWIEISARYQFNKNNEIEMLIVSRNIDERKKAELEQTYFSLHDHLTNLYNRRYFETELVRLDVKRNLPIGIIMADVNGLKLINDSFGHDIGDQLLIKAGSVIKSQLREDEIFARVGGDEFAILLTNTNEDTIKKIIKRICEAMPKEKVANIPLSISFGYDLKKKDSQVMVDVLKKAEDNMYRSKLYETRFDREKTVDFILESLFEKSPRERAHAQNVRRLCEMMGKELGFDQTHINKIGKAAYYHDIGKIGMDESILNKANRLTDKELFTVRKHPESGWRIINSVSSLSDLSEFIMTHHEWVNGAGYPRGLKEDMIPLEAKVIAIADAYDVMTNPSSYKIPLNELEAKAELKKYSGIQFDPTLVDLFITKVIH